ncbi:hypothetical protein ASPCADRAFT_509833 [Aspergillus carbonarius ITEM 5010]|uniref:Uncharacterized protein n=1 Tax=Aspergillus carbonarius (strain ITEM 5010) TaxID=602072 RepID=A0A1R3RBP8_ASPC5|nr:hypothetical protein ASPCADRAFT_509833 [Aspergillus carbonarius ITEM 5010]
MHCCHQCNSLCMHMEWASRHHLHVQGNHFRTPYPKSDETLRCRHHAVWTALCDQRAHLHNTSKIEASHQDGSGSADRCLGFGNYIVVDRGTLEDKNPSESIQWS